MDGYDGLILATYIAPAVALRKGKYDADNRPRESLTRRVIEVVSKYF